MSRGVPNGSPLSIPRADPNAGGGGGTGSELTVRDESGTVSDADVVIQRFPDGTVVSNAAGDVSIREVPTGVIGAVARRNAATQTVSTLAKLTLDTSVHDSDGIFDNGNDRMTVPAGMAGPWLITAQTYSPGNTDRSVFIYKNGAAVAATDMSGSNEEAMPPVVYIDPDAAVGDYYEVYAEAALSVTFGSASVASEETRLSAFKLGSGNVAGLDADRQLYTGGHIALTNTSWAAIGALSDLVVPAQAGDVLWVDMSAFTSNSASEMYLDMATMVSSSPVNYISLGGGAASNRGVMAWGAVASAYTHPAGGVQYVVQSGDIENGNVTLRFYNRCASATGKTVYANSDIPVHYSVVNLRGGTASQPTGTELDYAEFTSLVTSTATVEDSATAVVTGNAVVYDGSTPVMIEFYVPFDDNTGSFNNIYNLFEDGSDIGRLTQSLHPATGRNGVNGMRRMTPTAGSHTYSVRLWVSGGTGDANAGAGGNSTDMPGFIRITKV